MLKEHPPFTLTNPKRQRTAFSTVVVWRGAHDDDDDVSVTATALEAAAEEKKI